MGLKLDNKAQLQKYILSQIKVFERVIIREMEILVARLENHAKDNAGYQDQTANLKNSIGGVVLKDGRAVSYSGFSGDGGDEGRNYIDSLIGNFGGGYVVLIVAGMEYASYVENYHNLNVLKKSELLLPMEMNKMFEKIKSKIK